MYLSILFYLSFIQISSSIRCKKNEWKCVNGNQCIHKYQHCDRIVDCLDESDETYDSCNEFNFKTKGDKHKDKPNDFSTRLDKTTKKSSTTMSKIILNCNGVEDPIKCKNLSYLCYFNSILVKKNCPVLCNTCVIADTSSTSTSTTISTSTSTIYSKTNGISKTINNFTDKINANNITKIIYKDISVNDSNITLMTTNEDNKLESNYFITIILLVLVICVLSSSVIYVYIRKKKVEDYNITNKMHVYIDKNVINTEFNSDENYEEIDDNVVTNEYLEPVVLVTEMYEVIDN